MIYLGQYYESKGYNTSLNIPRNSYSDTLDTSLMIEIKNNITNDIVSQNENLVNGSSSPYYYEISGLDTSSLTDGEYTLNLYDNDALVWNGVLSYRDSAPSTVSVYENPTKYKVYE